MMPLVLTQIELLKWQVNFRTDDLQKATELLAGIDGTDVELTLPNGESGSLYAFVSAQGTRAADSPEIVKLQLKDQETFTVTLDFSQLQGASLKCRRGPVPLPQNIYALYRIHQRVESVKLSAYQVEQDINAFTGISDTWGKQITLVTKLQQDGSRSLSFTFEDTTPVKTKIGMRKTTSNKDEEPKN
jgi:hypothetical protein